MMVIVNGDPKPLPDGTSIVALLKELGLERAVCAVEVNKQLVQKTRHAESTLKDGDRVEVVTLVGGG